MKRLLLALVPWMALTSAARAQAPADVVFTHHGIIKEPCVRVDDECYVPFAILDDVGWTYVQKGDDLVIRTDDQRVEVGVREIANKPMIPLRFTMDKLGGDTSWDGNRLLALAGLTEVQIRKGKFTIESSLGVLPKVSTMSDPNRIVVDIQGAKLSRRTNVDLDGTARISQFKPDVVRVVLESDFNDKIGKKKFDAGTSFAFEAGLASSEDITKTAKSEPDSNKVAKKVESSDSGSQDSPTKPVQSGDVNPLTQNETTTYDPASDPDMPAPMTLVSNVPLVGPLTLDSESAKLATLTLKIVGGKVAMPNFARPEPNVIEISLPGARQADGADFAGVKGETVHDVTVHSERNTLIVDLVLARPMGVELSLAGSDLKIVLFKPSIGNGRLAGKVVVVDPGHGGHDNGTQYAGLSEKNFTLSIGKLLSEKLSEEGATVIMTRKTDVFIPLGDRPGLANRNGADFFVSVHINSNELDNSASGTITFYHTHDPICQLLADCIEHEIVKVNGIGGMGTWSDQKVYHSGFAVLRGAKMPAVLVECGFLNTAKDRTAMQTDQFQNDVADAIVKGIKAYLGDEGKKK